MRFLLLISFLVLFSCNQKKEKKQVNPKSELALLSEDIINNPNNATLFVKRAAYFEEKGNFEAALMDYKECVKLQPKNADFHFKLASLYFEIAKFDRTKPQYPDKAFNQVEQALELNPNHISSLVLKGELYLIGNKMKEAIKQLNMVIELDYNTSKAHLLKGYIYSSLQEEKKAIQFFHNATSINPSYEEAYIQLGLLHQKNNDSTAVLYYKNVLRINPKNKLALFNLAKFFQDSQRWNESIQTYTQLLQFYPTYADGYYNIGFVHIKLGLYDVAINDFAQAISFNSKFYEAYFSRGHCYETLGDIYRAELDYKKAININPDYQDAKDALANLYFKNNQIKK